jgi:hypothetical protein
MSNQITTAFVQQYSANVMHLLQQKGSRLRGSVNMMAIKGKNAFFDQIGATTAQKVTSRHADSPLIHTPHDRRRVSLVDYDWGDLVDDFDKIRTLIDPTSAYALNAAWAMGRAIDDEIIAAFFGSAYTGETGSTTVTFPSSQQIAVNYVESGSAANSGLTIGKLRSAKETLDAAEVDPSEERYIACSAKQVHDLLQTTEVTSSDYNSVKALVQGDVNSFMGFQFIRTERLLTDSNSYRRVVCWNRGGLGLALGKEPTAKITERADKRYSTYVYYAMSIGATRVEEERVVEIKCSEA